MLQESGLRQRLDCLLLRGAAERPALVSGQGRQILGPTLLRKVRAPDILAALFAGNSRNPQLRALLGVNRLSMPSAEEAPV